MLTVWCLLWCSVAALGKEIVSEEKLPNGVWRDSVKVVEEPGFAKNEENEGCYPKGETIREVVDDFLSPEEVDTLLKMMEKGMAASPLTGGPTILDINTGFMKDSQGLVNIYSGPRQQETVKFSPEEYKIYSILFDRIKAKVMKLNELDNLWFTAPTFVARLVGNPDWSPAMIHDEYWHPHVDKDNTEHYDYSGLVYLSTYGKDFTGGEFMFMDKGEKGEYVNTTVLPRKGRFITFSSGKENLHRVMPVLSGVRYALSMWFTCDQSREFDKFLDGNAHTTFTTLRDEL